MLPRVLQAGAVVCVCAMAPAKELAAEPVSWNAASCPDVALVLAIDASSSIDDHEYDLQMQGYARAFRDPAVLAAIREAGRVEIAVVIWGDAQSSAHILPFRVVATSADAQTLSDALGRTPRQVTGSTGLGRGLQMAVELILTEKPCAARRLIDVSGDGAQFNVRGQRAHITPAAIRDHARANGITINALAIEDDHASLGDYYRDTIMTGAESFVMRIGSMSDFGDAIIEKLHRELTATADPVPNGSRQANEIHSEDRTMTEAAI